MTVSISLSHTEVLEPSEVLQVKLFGAPGTLSISITSISGHPRVEFELVNSHTVHLYSSLLLFSVHRGTFSLNLFWPLFTEVPVF